MEKDLELELVCGKGLWLASDLDCGHRRHTQQMCHMVTLPWATGEGPPGLTAGDSGRRTEVAAVGKHAEVYSYMLLALGI